MNKMESHSMRERQLQAVVFGAILLASATSTALAQSQASAKIFINSIFQLYKAGGHGLPTTPPYFHPTLLALIQTDEKAAEAVHEVPGPLDADLICDCQQWDGIFVRSITARIDAKGHALVDAIFDITLLENRTKDDLRKMRYTLVFVGGAWRIYDIEDLSRSLEPGHSRSLRREIERDIHDLKRDAKELR